MSKFLDPFRLLLISLAGWMNQRQLNAMERLRELQEQLGGNRLRLNDDQRGRLAAKAKGLGWTAGRNFVEHYHSDRNHQGLANRILCPEAGHLGASGAIQRRQRVGGMLNDYYRDAA